MRKRFLIPIPTLLLITFILPQNSMVAGPVIVNHEHEVHPLGSHLQILEDPTRQLILADVTSPTGSTHFIQNQTEVPNYGYTESTYWVRIPLRHDLAIPSDWWLKLHCKKMSSIDLYIYTDKQDGYQERHTGDYIPFEKRESAYAGVPSPTHWPVYTIAAIGSTLLTNN